MTHSRSERLRPLCLITRARSPTAVAGAVGDVGAVADLRPRERKLLGLERRRFEALVQDH
jgi:hypothetical protein